MTKRDIVFLVADSAMEQLLLGFFGRDQFHRRLDCQPIDFDPSQDCVVSPNRDPGVYNSTRGLLGPYEKLYQRAVVMLDAEWAGSPGANRIRADITESLRHAWEQFVVIVIEPELEAWIWQDSPNVARALKCRTDFRKVLHYSGHWPEGQAKPKDPKAALEYLRREQRADRSNALFRRLADTVSAKGCQDEAHQLLRDTLRAWFPEGPQ